MKIKHHPVRFVFEIRQNRCSLLHKKRKGNSMSKITVKFIMEEGCDDLRPAKAHEDDAAYDLRSRVDITAQPGKVTLIPTGLHIELPVGYEAQVRPRSAAALLNCRMFAWSISSKHFTPVTIAKRSPS